MHRDVSANAEIQDKAEAGRGSGTASPPTRFSTQRPIWHYLLGIAFLAGLFLRPYYKADFNAPGPLPPRVTIRNGTIIGRRLTPSAVDFFGGIPYALPPTGYLRLRRPRWRNETFEDGKYYALDYSLICPGHGGDNIGYPFDEDCLTLNILRPSGTSPNSKLPVMVYIHGGGSFMGSSRDIRYNLTWLIEESVAMQTPIIALSINYRVGEFGYLLSRQVKYHGLENLGYWDQRLALHWVQENIRAFGGDPKKVTIWGESAGGYSVAQHLLAFGGRNDQLFRAAIMQSGAPTMPDYVNPIAAQGRFEDFAARLGCSEARDIVDCLREIPWRDYWAANGNVDEAITRWKPSIDGQFNHRYPSQLLREHAFVNVPIIVGANQDEGVSFGRHGVDVDEQIAAHLLAESSDCARASTIDSLISLYSEDPADGCPFHTGTLPSSKGGKINKKSDAIIGDIVIHAPRRRMAEAYSEAGNKVWSYHFEHVPWYRNAQGGSQHFDEVPYIFGSRLPHGAGPDGTDTPLGNSPEDLYLSRVLQRQWISFATHVDPNKHGINGVNHWPTYDKGAQNMVYANSTEGGIRPESDDFRREQIHFINTWAEDFNR